MTEKMPEIFWEIHSGLPREGLGDHESTQKAYIMLKGLPENPRILDIGCGPACKQSSWLTCHVDRLTRWIVISRFWIN